MIGHILQRRGQSVPANDGRKIVLVLWGGIMRGVRGGGAVMALSELGLSGAFDEIYTVSAGFPTACFFLAGQTNAGMSMFGEELCSKKFLNRWRFWQGMDVDYLLKTMRDKKSMDVARILAHPSRLYVRAVNLQKKTFEYLEIHQVGKENFWPLMRASVSVPILHRHPARIGEFDYIDTNINGYLAEHIRYVLATDATDILVIYNAPAQRWVDTSSDPRVFEIYPPKNWKLSRFELRPEALYQAGRDMGRLVKSAFGQDAGINL